MKQARIIITEKCNFKCSYCCNNIDAVYDTFQKITLNDMIPKIREYETIAISGGEPTLNLNYLEMILRSIPEDKKVYLYTNGTGLTIDFIEQNKKYIDGINISNHQEYDQVSRQ